MKQLVVYNHKSDEIGVRIGKGSYKVKGKSYRHPRLVGWLLETNPWPHIVEQSGVIIHLSIEEFKNDYIDLGWL